MTKPIKASYGCKENRHDLLMFEGEFEPPKELLGLTDMPAGHAQPKETWWPAINCGPINDKHWALWCVRPDDSAPRGGMVKSEVFLWELNEISKVSDISSYLFELCSLSEFISLPETLFINVSQALTEHSGPKVVCFENCLLQLIDRLWKRLWPSAKEGFSVRTLFSPPQTLNSMKSPTLYFVPLSLKNQWVFNFVRFADSWDITSVNKATLYLSGEDDCLIEEMISECGYLDGQFLSLQRLARAADAVEQFRCNQNLENATAAMRTILMCAPDQNNALELKKEILKTISIEIDKSNEVEDIISFCNMDNASFPKSDVLNIKITDWIKSNLIHLNEPMLIKLFDKCLEGKSHTWWRSSAVKGIKEVLVKPSLFPKITKYLKITDFKIFFDESDLDKNSFGDKLFKIFSQDEASNEDLNAAKAWAINYHWPCLHVLSVIKLSGPENVFQRHYEMMPNWRDGMPFLVEYIEDEELINNITDERFKDFLDLALARASKRPSILNFIDIEREAHFTFWLAHVDKGGALFPLRCNENEFSLKLLNQIDKINRQETFKKVAKKIANPILKAKERDAICEKLNEEHQTILADEMILSLAKNNGSMPIEEPYLLKAMERYLESTESPQANVLLSYITVQLWLRQREVTLWIKKVPALSWIGYEAQLGQIIQKKAWEEIANSLFDSSFSFFPSTPHLKKVIDECVEQLNTVNKITYKLRSGNHSSYSEDEIILFLESICSEIASDRLDYFWGKAGGKISKLDRAGTSSEQWANALKSAKNGALELRSLVNVLLDDFPNNEKLQQAKKMLANK